MTWFSSFKAISERRVGIRFLEYDWALNEAGP
jgi:hypothetical protein